MSSEEIFDLEGALEKLPPSGNASSELEGGVEQLDHLQDVSPYIINKFGDFSRSINSIHFFTRKVTSCSK